MQRYIADDVRNRFAGISMGMPEEMEGDEPAKGAVEGVDEVDESCVMGLWRGCAVNRSGASPMARMFARTVLRD